MPPRTAKGDRYVVEIGSFTSLLYGKTKLTLGVAIGLGILVTAGGEIYENVGSWGGTENDTGIFAGIEEVNCGVGGPCTRYVVVTGGLV